MTYGDGDGVNYRPLTSLDVIGHEITHGVTEHSAGLIYSYESGALNESFSDIFGVAIDYFANPNEANFLIGDQISLKSNGLRDMENPNSKGDPNTYKGAYWKTGSQDYGGVHSNSGVQNYWFYLLVNGGTGTNDNSFSYTLNGIGMEAAAAISYRNLTVYLTPNSTYLDARNYAIQAAKDIYGACSEEVDAVAKAWYAVGVGEVYTNSVLAEMSASAYTTCSVPFEVSFQNASVNATNYVWDFGDGTTSTEVNPVHTYQNEGDFTVQLIANSTPACGTSDTLLVAKMIQVTLVPITLAVCEPRSATTNTTTGTVNFSLNTIAESVSASEDGYQNLVCTNNTVLTAGKNYPLSISTTFTGNQHMKVWLDINNDGEFDASELLNQTTGSSLNENLLVPNTAFYNQLLRFRIGIEKYQNTLNDACTPSQTTQFFDYGVMITPNLGLPPVADFEGLPTIIYANDSVSFRDLTQNFPTSWSWTFTGSSAPQSTTQHPTVLYNQGGSYPVKLTVSNEYGEDMLEKFMYVTVIDKVVFCEAITSTSPAGEISFDSDVNTTEGDTCRMSVTFPCSAYVNVNKGIFQGDNSDEVKVRLYGSGTSSVGGATFAPSSGSGVGQNSIERLELTYIKSAANVKRSVHISWGVKYYDSLNENIGLWVSPSNPLTSEFIHFDASQQLDPNTYSYSWDFGDGTTQISDVGVAHAYAVSGEYEVKLTVSNCIESKTFTQTITVNQNMFKTPNDVLIYPNPSDGAFSIKSAYYSPVKQLTIFDNTGKLVWDHAFEPSFKEQQVEMRVETGHYRLRVLYADDKTHMLPFILH
jgi:PKD repeat protein